MKSTSNDNFQPSRAVWWDSVFLGLLILAMCTQLDVRQVGRDTLAEGLGYATKTLKVAVPDVALLWTFLWFMGRTTVLRAWRRLWWPPLACWALIAAMILSALHSPTIVSTVSDGLAHAHGLKGIVKALVTKESKEAIAETIQYGLYFLVAPWLFVNLIYDRRQDEFISRKVFALGTFTLAIAGTLIIGLIQTITFREAAPRALWTSPNLFGCFLAISLLFPFYFVGTLLGQNAKLRQVPIIVLGLFCITSVASIWAIAGLVFSALLLIAFSRAARPKYAAAILLLGVLQGILFTSPAVRAQRNDFLRVNSAAQPVKKQYVEWYAALGWADPRQNTFATGVGPGNYQLNIGPYYGSLPNEEKMPPDSNNLYLVQAVSIGVLGLGALLWVLAHFARQAWVARKLQHEDWLGTAVLASLGAWFFINLFHATIVRGAGIVLAFLLSLAAIALLEAQHGRKMIEVNAAQLGASEDVKPDEEKI